MSLLTSSVGGVFSPEADARWRAEVRDPAGSATPVLATWRQGAAKALSYVAPVPAGWAARIEIHCERDNFVYSGTPWTGPFPYSADAAAWFAQFMAGYYAARHADLLALEAATALYAAEVAEYVAQYPPMVFKAWLIGSRGCPR